MVKTPEEIKKIFEQDNIAKKSIREKEEHLLLCLDEFYKSIIVPNASIDMLFKELLEFLESTKNLIKNNNDLVQKTGLIRHLFLRYYGNKNEIYHKFIEFNKNNFSDVQPTKNDLETIERLEKELEEKENRYGADRT